MFFRLSACCYTLVFVNNTLFIYSTNFKLLAVLVLPYRKARWKICLNIRIFYKLGVVIPRNIINLFVGGNGDLIPEKNLRLNLKYCTKILGSRVAEILPIS